MDIICSLLTDMSKESALNAMPFVQLLLPSTSKPISIFTAMISLMSIFSYSAVQVAATKVLSRICAIASGLRPYSLENIVLPDPLQVQYMHIPKQSFKA
ncbi:hypothetical protein HPP92_005014 [Vanilla planifolia]|uniref:Uncharacterized protein n=1 Tax=Vanilla planifolia TaxID=51239 RepID=A0A835RGC2_VANPL|nr:hypothetical protein HPP92_005014 [Vanilla planifolia]